MHEMSVNMPRPKDERARRYFLDDRISQPSRTDPNVEQGLTSENGQRAGVSGDPTDNVTTGSPAENTVRLTIALEADEDWPSPLPPGGPLIAAFVATSGMNMVVPIG